MTLLLLVASVPPSFAADTAPANPRQTWQLLDYIAVDYAGAVKNQRVVSQSEYAEMREFAATVQVQLGALPATPEQAALVADADSLVAAVASKADSKQVADLARRLGERLLQSYPIDAVPGSAPEVARAARLYVQQCAACHGPGGHGDGPAAASLDPPPIAFTDATRAAQRSPFALYEVISQGLSGTAMTSFSALPEEDRWALAFYVGSMAYSPESRARGEALWREDDALRSRISTLDTLAHSSEAALAKNVGEDQAKAITAYLRSNPKAVLEPVAGSADGPLALARQRLAESAGAYAAGDLSLARSLALSSYLDGVEPIEPTLASRDRALMREIETAMGKYRAMLGRSVPGDEVSDQAAKIAALFDSAESVLEVSGTDATTAFFGSFTILLREGLEALLIVIGMIAFLRKAERREVLPYVHAGWIAALLAGVVTWGVATYLVGISGANREVTEGLSAVFAAAVLLSVGIWMHQKSLAGRWQQYLHEKMSKALTHRSALFLFSLAFIAVYREVFETILFFAAMWSEQSKGAILAGLGAGSVTLALIALLLLRFSRRLPIAKFFSISSILIAVLSVVLVGKGVAALQEAGWVAQAIVAFPRIEWLGMYPSWQSLSAQVLVALVAIIGFGINARSGRATVGVTGP